MREYRKRRKEKKGSILIVSGLLFMLAAAGLALYNYLDSRRAGIVSEEIASQLLDSIMSQNNDTPPYDPAADPETTEPEQLTESESGDPASNRRGAVSGRKVSSTARRSGDLSGQDERAAAALGMYTDTSGGMPVNYYDGYDYIGLLEIPYLGLILPVMAQWDYTRLRLAPCLYSGSYYQDDMVICAHNYATHFGGIRWLPVGSDVYFTNTAGDVVHYVVANIETIFPTDVRDMVLNLNNAGTYYEDWDLTLFTCTTDGQTRHTVRCIRVA